MPRFEQVCLDDIIYEHQVFVYVCVCCVRVCVYERNCTVNDFRFAKIERLTLMIA